MALSYTQNIGDGVTRNFNITFPYIARSHVVARVDGVSVPFTWLSANTVQLQTTPASGAIVDIRRQTPRTELLVDFVDGSTLVESDLDLSALQVFYLAQEAFDLGEASLGVTEDGSFSALQRRISNVLDPQLPQDVVTKRWAETGMSSQLALATAAQAGAATARSAAEAAQAGAVAARQQSEAARDAAIAARDSASGHRLNAQNAQTAAEAARDAAQGFRNTASVHASDATASASTASQKAAEAAASAAAAALFDPSSYYTRVQIDQQFLRATNGVVPGALAVSSNIVVRAAGEGLSAMVQLSRGDGSTAGRLSYVPGSSAFTRVGSFNAAGTGWANFIDMPENNASPTTLNGSAILTAANVAAHTGTLLPEYVSGLVVSYLSGTACIVSSGGASKGGTVVRLTSAMTKRLDVAWSAGSGSGGLDTGAVQPNQTYHVHIIRNASTGAGDLLFSLSAGGPAVPAGWNQIQRIQSVRTDGNGSIRPFNTSWKTTLLGTMVADVFDSALSTTSKLYSLSVPTGVSVEALFRAHIYDPGVAAVLFSSPTEQDQTAALNGPCSIHNAVGNGRAGTDLRVFTNPAGQVRAQATGIAMPLQELMIHTYGWVDHSIPRI